MRKLALLAPLMSFGIILPGFAACPTFPYTFSNGSTADASQVNANFQNVTNCFAPLANPAFSGKAAFASALGGWSGDAVMSATFSGSSGWAGSLYSSYTGQNPGGVLVLRSDSASAVQISMWYQQSNIGSITSTTTSTAYNTTSDYRLKTNVEPIQNGLAQLIRLQPDQFNWKTAPSEPKAIGFLAHELQAVVPSAVTGEKDAVNPDGSIKPQQVDYSKLVPLLVAAIKDQQTEIENLKSDFNQLKQR